MAFVLNQQDENQNGQVQINSGQSGNTSSTGTSAQGASQPQNSFSSLQKLMSMNQNAPNVAQKVGENVQQAQNEQNKNIQDTTGKIGPSMKYDSNQLNQNIEQGNWGDLSKVLNTNYQGPQQGSINVDAKNLNQATQQGQALGSKAGQEQLLKNMYGRADYTSGQNKLDSFLQGRNQDFQVAAAKARNQAHKLGAQADQQDSALNNLAGSTATSIENTKAQTKQGLGDYDTNLKNKTEQAVNEASAHDQAIADKTAKLKSQLASGQSDADTLKQLGFDQNDYTYGVNLGDYVSSKGGGASFNNVMDKQNADRFNHINQLLGNQGSDVDLNQAGTYQGAENVFDRQGLANAIAGAQGNYNAGMHPQRQTLDAANDLLNMVRERDKLPMGSPQWAMAQAAIGQKYKGAQTNGITREDWALGQQQKAQQDFDAIKQQLDSQYLKKVGVV